MDAIRLQRRLAWAIAARLAVGALLLGAAVLVEVETWGLESVRLFVLVGLIFLLSLGSALSLRFVPRHRWLIDLQLAGDALIVSAFVFVTGGVTSYYSSLYVLPIIGAAMFQMRRGGLLVALLSTLLYSGIVAGQYLRSQGLLAEGWLSPSPADLPSFAVARYAVAVTVFGFFAVAWLSGSLAESLRRTHVRLERASHEIADLQAFNEHVIDSLTSGLVTTDVEGRILTFNRTAMAIAGLPGAAVLGRPIGDVLQLPGDVRRVVEHGLDSSRPSRVEFPYRTSRGSVIEIGLSVTDLQAPGGRSGLLFTFQDVTDLKRLERDAQLRKRLAAVGEMAAGIAHEIRNPLASMSGSIQILRRELPLNADQAQLMDIVLRESERLNDTIKSFLAYARPRRFQVDAVDLGRLLQDTALILRNSAEVRAGHAIDVDVPRDAVVIEADEHQIRQVIWNLATNGLRAMTQGGHLRLSARRERTDEGDRRAVLEVADEGVGIPEGAIEGIFQPFHGSFRGSGLGLAIVHRIVNDYQGDIGVRSTPGTGTCVTVSFPAQALGATVEALAS